MIWFRRSRRLPRGSRRWKDLLGSFLQHRAGWESGASGCGISRSPWRIKDPRYSKIFRDIARYCKILQGTRWYKFIFVAHPPVSLGHWWQIIIVWWMCPGVLGSCVLAHGAASNVKNHGKMHAVPEASQVMVVAQGKLPWQLASYDRANYPLHFTDLWCYCTSLNWNAQIGSSPKLATPNFGGPWSSFH